MANPPLILIVDDEASFREIFSTKLKAVGFNVETAEDGTEGIKKAKELKPDLVLMDVEMPGISGVDAMIKLKEDPKTEELKILFLTALGDPRAEIQEINRRLSKEMGAIGYLKKTDDLNQLVDYIRNFLT